MRVTYKDLETKSYSQLIRQGATEDQLLNKLSNYYLKENRQLVINERQGKTISKAMADLKKGRVRQGIYIHRTAKTNITNDLKNLKRISKHFGKDSFASTLLKEYRRGEINVYQLNTSVYRYQNNISEYEANKTKVDSFEVNVDGYFEGIIR